MSSPPPESLSPERVYHLELRHFPRNLCRFNLSGGELWATVLEPWTADRPFELGELTWDPRQARLIVLEGQRLPPDQLSMGRGWRTAQREGRDVTSGLLATAAERARSAARERGTPARPSAGGGEGGSGAERAPAGGGEGALAAEHAAGDGGDIDLQADSLGLELLAQPGSERTPLSRVWELASARDPGGSASATLAIAERTVASLLRARLIALLRVSGRESAPQTMGEQDALAALRAPASWTGAEVWIRRL
jgi:hypothetical protein